MEEQNQKQKKKMGAVKGLLLAILIVFLIAVIALLARMVISGDGDYFKPIKEIFGIEGKEENQKSSETGKSSSKSSARYTLLSEDVTKSGVKHYRMKVDVKDFASKSIELFTSESSATNLLSDNDEINDNLYKKDEKEDIYSSKYSDEEDDIYSSKYSDDGDEDEDILGKGLSDYDFEQIEQNRMNSIMSNIKTLIDLAEGSEMYIDVYFDGNELVQAVLGVDYFKFLENIYDYGMKEDFFDEKEEIENFEDFLKYINKEVKNNFDKDEMISYVYKQMTENNDLSEYGLKEKDLKEMLDFNFDDGLIEIYINGTTKLKGVLSMYLESDDFAEELEYMEDEINVKIDEDEIIESILKGLNKSEFSECGIKFEEVK